jgi:hypothetical protein
MVGAPLLVAAGGVLMGGLAAVIVHNAPQVQEAANDVGHSFTTAFTEAAHETIPMFAVALHHVADEADHMAKVAKPAFDGLYPAIESVTRGVTGLVNQALPGLVRAIETGRPVFQGFQNLLTSIGSGLGNFFSIVSGHAPAMGTTLTALGDTLDALFRVLGEVTGAGSELGMVVLPALATVLHVLADVLGVISPLLPGIVLGFLAWKAAGAIAPLLGSLAGQLDTVGIKALMAADNLTLSKAAGAAAAAGFGAAATGARGLEAAMGPIGWIIAGVSLLVPLLMGQSEADKKVESATQAMTQALQQSKGAIDDNVRASAALQAQTLGLFDAAAKWGVSQTDVMNALLGVPGAMDKVNSAAANYEAGLRGVDQAAYKNADGSYQQAYALGIHNQATDDAIRKSDAWQSALTGLAGNTEVQIGKQQELAAVLAGSADAEEINARRLQAIANGAGAANSEINLLKGALDALSGKTVSMGEAEVAVTNALVAAKTALKDKTGALVDDTGEVDKSTEAGAALWSSLHRVADAGNTVIATMTKHGETTDAVLAKDDELRKSFIAQAREMGLSAAQAENLANELYGIPEERRTEITVDTTAATAAAKALQERIDAIKSKTVTVTVNGQVVGQHVAGLNGGPGGTQLANARGNIVRAFAEGGFQSMPGGLATVVPPNTLRVIGDRVTDDEAYIPINDSARSLAILAQTAGRMGYEPGPAWRSRRQDRRAPVLVPDHRPRRPQGHRPRGARGPDGPGVPAWLIRSRGPPLTARWWPSPTPRPATRCSVRAPGGCARSQLRGGRPALRRPRRRDRPGRPGHGQPPTLGMLIGRRRGHLPRPCGPAAPAHAPQGRHRHADREPAERRHAVAGLLLHRRFRG